MEKIKHFFLWLLTPMRVIMFKLFLPKHKFKVSDLVYKDGTRVLYEVDALYYNRSLEPIVIVRAYPNGKQLMGISYHEVLEFREFRKPTSAHINTTPSDVATTPHDNYNFGKRKKK